MSRIGRLPVAIPAGVTVEVAENNVVTVKGPKGTLTKELPVEMEIKVEGEEVIVTRPSDLKKMKSLHGLTRTLINNMVVGVTDGYEKVLEVNGVGSVSYTHLAKNSVANFKIREGMPIGCKVTLRGEKMYEFVDRLINLSLPRVRDFRGVNPNAFDGRGNYALGIKEQLIFPEIEYDKIDKVRGMDVIFVTTAKTDEEARELLTQFNMPFAK